MPALTFIKRILLFVFHQLVATVGVGVLAAFLTYCFAPILQRFVESPLTVHRISAALTETTGFPIQVALAMVLGLSLNSLMRQRMAYWVWVLPLLVLICWMIYLPASALDQNTVWAKIKYFFGSTCKPTTHCGDQILATLPALSAISYSLGAYLAFIRYRRSTRA